MWQKKIHLIGLTGKMIFVERDRTRKRFNALRDYLACIEYIRQHVTNGGFELLEEESTCPLKKENLERKQIKRAIYRHNPLSMKLWRVVFRFVRYYLRYLKTATP